MRPDRGKSRYARSTTEGGAGTGTGIGVGTRRLATTCMAWQAGRSDMCRSEGGMCGAVRCYAAGVALSVENTRSAEVAGEEERV